LLSREGAPSRPKRFENDDDDEDDYDFTALDESTQNS
jgi:hypothetical protein